MIPLATPDLSGNEERYLRECISTGFVSSVGPFVGRFEQMIAEISGTPGAVATSSGTCALHLALHVAGVRPGDLVLTPTLTFIATANAISHCHADPWLVDVEPSTWNLDPVKVATLLAEETRRDGDHLIHRPSGRRVAAILAVHGLGLPADLLSLKDIGGRFGIPVVADAAAALGSSIDGVPVGSLADLTVFSFNGNKTVTSGGGGAIVGTDPDLIERAHHLCSTARVGQGYEHDAIGFNYRLTNLCAAVGVAQLELFGSFIEAKRRVRDIVDESIAHLPGLSPFPRGGGEGTCWFTGVLLGEGFETEAFRAAMEERGVAANPFWKPIHLQAPYAHAPCAPAPVAESIWSRIVTLPCSTWMSEEDIGHVVAALHSTHEAMPMSGVRG